MYVSGPPSSWALTKSPTAGRKTSTAPASTPWKVAGNVTCRNVFQRRAVEVLARLDQRRVHAVERRVDRQDHEGQVAVDEPADHRPGGVQEA